MAYEEFENLIYTILSMLLIFSKKKKWNYKNNKCAENSVKSSENTHSSDMCSYIEF